MAAGATMSETASNDEFPTLSPNPALISNSVISGGGDVPVSVGDAFSGSGYTVCFICVKGGAEMGAGATDVFI